MYGQINYPQRLGTGPYTIAEAGCFLTSFTNLLGRMGVTVDPPTLNNYFVQHGNYVDVDGDRTMDDLAWGTISAYNGEIVPVKIGGAGWPDGNDAIVKFVYKSPRTNNTVTHFCLVADHVAGTIVDSWDGVTKKSPYGTPVAWARYERHAAQVAPPPAPPATTAYTVENIPERSLRLKKDTSLWDLNQRTWPGMVNSPILNRTTDFRFTATAIAHHALGGNYYMPDPNQPHGYNVVDCEVVEAPAPTPVPVNPAPAPPQGAINLPSGQKYTVVVTLPGYLTATMAGNGDRPTATVNPGEYYVFNVHSKRHDLINVTTVNGKPGSWINTNLNVIAPPPAPEPEPTPEPAPEPTPEPVAPVQPVKQWDMQYKPFVDTSGNLAPVKYVALQAYDVEDFNEAGQPVHLAQYDYIVIGGTFTGPDGNIYGRPQDAVKHSTPEKEYWYGVPMNKDILEPYDELFSIDTTRSDRRTLKTESWGDMVADIIDEIQKQFGKLKTAFSKKKK